MLHLVDEEAKNDIHYQRFHHPHPRVQLKMEVVWLSSWGKSNREIALLTNLSENTVRQYIKDYHQGGIEKLKKTNFYQPKSELDNYQQTLEKYFQENPPMSFKEAAAKIEELTGIKRSETQVGKFLKKLGFKKLKIGYVPGKANLEIQEKYHEEKLKPRLDEAQKGERAVFFVDAAHFVMQPFLGWIWCVSRVFIKSPSGRKRWNVLGALNAITKQVITVKKKCLYGKYYENFDKFRTTISQFVKNAHIENKREVESLLTLRFQTFEHTQIMNL